MMESPLKNKLGNKNAVAAEWEVVLPTFGWM
jgi:hypothetical protein